VAMMGKMGYDIQIAEMNEKDLKFSQEAIKNYKRINHVIWFGNLFRLVSPYEENRAVLMYVNDDQSKSVLFSYTLNARYGESFNKVKLNGLNPAKNYKIQEINLYQGSTSRFRDNGKTFSGDYLMKAGIAISNEEALKSSVFEIIAE